MKGSLWIQPCSTKPFEQSLLLALPEQLCPRGSMDLSCSDLPSSQKNLNNEERSSPSAPVSVCTHLGHRSCPKFLLQGAAETQQRADGNARGPQAVPGLQEVTQGTAAGATRSLLSSTPG